MKRLFGLSLLMVILSGSLFAQLPPKELDLYICIGQSNMAGRAAITDELKDTLDNVYLFNDRNEFERAANPLNRYSNIRKDISMQKLCPVYAFAKTLAKARKSPIGVVVNARGGSSINSWLKGSEDGYYEKSMERIKAAISKGGKVKAIIWHQGEADCKFPESYKKKLLSLVSDLRKDLNSPDLLFVVGQISQWNWTNREEGTVPFNRMIMNVSDFIPNAFCISSEGCDQSKDNTDPHFGTQGQLLLGKRYAEMVLKHLH